MPFPFQLPPRLIKTLNPVNVLMNSLTSIRKLHPSKLNNLNVEQLVKAREQIEIAESSRLSLGEPMLSIWMHTDSLAPRIDGNISLKREQPSSLRVCNVVDILTVSPKHIESSKDN